MGFRFRKSVSAGPFRLNFSKSGVGWSVGGKGFRYTKKANGGHRATASIPGTGISYVKEYGNSHNDNGAVPPNITASNKGCLTWALYILFLPFMLIYWYAKWCNSNNQKESDKKIYKRTWVWVSALVLVAGIIFGCVDAQSKGRGVASSMPSSSVSATAEPAPTSPSSTLAPTVASSPAPTAEPAPEPSPEPTAEPTPEPTPAPTSAPTEAPVQEQSQGAMVWIASSGKGTVYHSQPQCGRMKNSTQISLSDAQARGLPPCEKCC